jgi:hypothetical protein
MISTARWYFSMYASSSRCAARRNRSGRCAACGSNFLIGLPERESGSEQHGSVVLYAHPHMFRSAGGNGAASLLLTTTLSATTKNARLLKTIPPSARLHIMAGLTDVKAHNVESGCMIHR